MPFRMLRAPRVVCWPLRKKTKTKTFFLVKKNKTNKRSSLQGSEEEGGSLDIPKMDWDDSSSACTNCDTAFVDQVCSLFCSSFAEDLEKLGYLVYLDESYVHGDGASISLLRAQGGMEVSLEGCGLPGLFLAARLERKCRHFSPSADLPLPTTHRVWEAARTHQKGVLQCLEGDAGNGHDILVMELLPTIQENTEFVSFSIPLHACVLPLMDNQEQQFEWAERVVSMLGRIFLEVHS